MISQSIFFRLNHRYNYVTCKTPCNNCTCNSKPCDYLDYDNDFPFEADHTPLGYLQDRWLNSPSTALERHCALNPSAVECKIYED